MKYYKYMYPYMDIQSRDLLRMFGRKDEPIRLSEQITTLFCDGWKILCPIFIGIIFLEAHSIKGQGPPLFFFETYDIYIQKNEF